DEIVFLDPGVTQRHLEAGQLFLVPAHAARQEPLRGDKSHYVVRHVYLGPRGSDGSSPSSAESCFHTDKSTTSASPASSARSRTPSITRGSMSAGASAV